MTFPKCFISSGEHRLWASGPLDLTLSYKCTEQKFTVLHSHGLYVCLCQHN